MGCLWDVAYTPHSLLSMLMPDGGSGGKESIRIDSVMGHIKQHFTMQQSNI